jgi:hypothetical protein
MTVKAYPNPQGDFGGATSTAGMTSTEFLEARLLWR